jgi:hypothetical protein
MGTRRLADVVAMRQTCTMKAASAGQRTVLMAIRVQNLEQSQGQHIDLHVVEKGYAGNGMPDGATPHHPRSTGATRALRYAPAAPHRRLRLVHASLKPSVLPKAALDVRRAVRTSLEILGLRHEGMHMHMQLQAPARRSTPRTATTC